jgi:hypothetical protein
MFSWVNCKYHLLLAIFFLTSCLNHQKTRDNTKPASVYKVWEFKKIDSIKSLTVNLGSVWIGKNLLDLTDKDTLRFTYQSNRNNHTAYAYNIRHDTIFVQNNASYRILKLTNNELDLAVLFKNDTSQKGGGKAGFVMVYEAK